ncbi:hypothetical protein HanXRQr2_Chr14g0630911 [Helianthus annuus]|uniref:Uncharacterized protein n=1 Tax=Helianthus annuus TaxID=4232 RepID=A0A9K3E6M5_HELAN|nr:hypothetical protein HanXRQr2_Chr14g0630911 [Helianthus annuus]KAJ0839299.1 hypothetical protein HanPSC8_Chr14g0605141 [Helianthus annuus]
MEPRRGLYRSDMVQVYKGTKPHGSRFSLGSDLVKKPTTDDGMTATVVNSSQVLFSGK